MQPKQKNYQQGSAIEGIFSPTDLIVSLNSKSSTNLDIIIGQQSTLQPSIVNHFDKMGDSTESECQAAQSIAQQPLASPQLSNVSMSCMSKQAGEAIDIQSGDASTAALTNAIKSPKLNGAQLAPNCMLHLYAHEPALTCIKYQVFNQMVAQNSQPIQSKQHQKNTSDFTRIMRERWIRTVSNIPVVDKQDIRKEVMHINGGKIRPESTRRQHHAEYTQTSYLRIRQLEEAYTMFNYLDAEQNRAFKEYLASVDEENMSFSQQITNSLLKKKKLHIISQFDRSYAVQKIFDLHVKKEYKIETLFVAVGIFDHYLAAVGHWNFPRDKVCLLATASMLMAAKLEQPISPSFVRMISLLSEDEQQNVSKQQLIDLEAQILLTLGFDFCWPGPIQTMERFLRVLDFDQNKIVNDMGYQICKFQLNDSRFFMYRPSQLAACAVIISINIYRRDQEKFDQIGVFSEGQSAPSDNRESFFRISERKGAEGEPLLLMNTDIWNNVKVANITGYSIEMLKDALYDLSMFIRQNLSPDRLAGFDIEECKNLQNCRVDGGGGSENNS